MRGTPKNQDLTGNMGDNFASPNKYKMNSGSIRFLWYKCFAQKHENTQKCKELAMWLEMAAQDSKADLYKRKWMLTMKSNC